MYYILPYEKLKFGYRAHTDDYVYYWAWDTSDLSIEKITREDLILLIESGVDLHNICKVGGVSGYFISPTQPFWFSSGILTFGTANFGRNPEFYTRIVTDRRANSFLQTASFDIGEYSYSIYWTISGTIGLNDIDIAYVTQAGKNHFTPFVISIIRFFKWYVLILEISLVSNLYCLLSFDIAGKFVGAFSKSGVDILCEDKEFTSRMSVFYKEG